SRVPGLIPRTAALQASSVSISSCREVSWRLQSEALSPTENNRIRLRLHPYWLSNNGSPVVADRLESGPRRPTTQGSDVKPSSHKTHARTLSRRQKAGDEMLAGLSSGCGPRWAMYDGGRELSRQK